MGTHAQVDDPAFDPYVMEGAFGDTDLLAAGLFAQLQELADTRTPEGESWPRDYLLTGAGVPELANTPTEGMTDAEHAAFVDKLRTICIAKAHEWWPTYCESQLAIHTAERDHRGTIHLYSKGRLVVSGGTLPDYLEGLPITVASIPETAQDVTPQRPSTVDRDGSDAPQLPPARVARQEPTPMAFHTGRMGGRDGSGDGPWYSLDDGTRRGPRR